MPNTIEIIIQAKDQFSKTLTTVGDSSKSLEAKLLSLSRAVTAAVGTFEGFQGLRDIVAKTDELGEATRRLQLQSGLSAESASGLLAAFREQGVDADSAGRGLGIFAKNLINLNDSLSQGKAASTPFADSLTQLGLRLKDLLDKTGNLSDQGLNRLFDQFQKMGPSAEAAARAQDLFGRGGRDLLPILTQGSAGLAEMQANAKRLGLVLSQDNVDAIHNFSVAQREAKEATGGLELQIGTALLPVVARMAQAFIDIQPKIRAIFADIGATIKDFVDGPIGHFLIQFTADRVVGLIGIFKSVFAGIKDGIAFVRDVIHGDWAKAWDDLKRLASDAVKYTASFILQTFGNLANAVVDIFEGMVNGVIKRLNSIKLPSIDLGPLGSTPGGGLNIPEVNLPRFDSAKLGSVSDLWKKLGDEVATAGANAKGGIDPMNDALAATAKNTQTFADALSSAFSKIMSGGSRELDALQLQSDEIQLKLDQLPKQTPITKEQALASGLTIGGNQSFTAAYLKAHPEAVDNLIKQANEGGMGAQLLRDKEAIDQHIKILGDQQKIEKDRFDLANNVLPTERQRLDAEEKLIGLEGQATKPISGMNDLLRDLVNPALAEAAKSTGGFKQALDDAAGVVRSLFGSLASPNGPSPTAPQNQFLTP